MALLFNEKALPVYREGFVKKIRRVVFFYRILDYGRIAIGCLRGLFIDIGPSMI
jgi:hypothetical protein